MSEKEFERPGWPEWLVEVIREEHRLTRKQSLEAEARMAALMENGTREAGQAAAAAAERFERLVQQEARASRFLLEAVHRENQDQGNRLEAGLEQLMRIFRPEQ